MKLKLRSITVLILLVSVITMSCKDNNPVIKSGTSISDCGCDSLWTKPVSQDFVKILEQTTESDYPIWNDYDFTKGSFILNAGQPNDSTHCLGLWKEGKAISYKCSRDIPKMLTPLYSYYLNYKNKKETDSVRFGTYKNAPDFSSWMVENNIESAVYMPTDFPKFPFKIPALMKTQLAVHEAFHVEVTLRYWYTKEGNWPKWDKQPDVSDVQKCYSFNDTTQKLIKDEQNQLVNMIEALLDHKKSIAIECGYKFLELRESRYKVLKEHKVGSQDDIYIDCRDGEALMEIEEGLADYASWTKMYDIGAASKEDLIKRYKANQKAVYYLTGSMLMHACALMNNGKDEIFINKILDSRSIREGGSLLDIFKEQLNKYQ